MKLTRTFRKGLLGDRYDVYGDGQDVWGVLKSFRFGSIKKDPTDDKKLYFVLKSNLVSISEESLKDIVGHMKEVRKERLLL